MKNYLTLVLALSVVSSPAFASRARLESLSQDKNGSYFIDDARNYILNPAEISNYKKKLFLEYGTAANNASDNYTAGAAQGMAQGGFTNTFGDFTYGVFVNRESDRVNSLIATVNGAPFSAALINPDHALDLVFAGESAVKWGIDLYYAGSQNKSVGAGSVNKTTSVLAVKLGVNADKLAVFSTVGIMSNAKKDSGAASGPDSELKGKLAIDLGATYAVDNSLKVKVNGSSFGSTLDQAGVRQIETSTTIASVGAGWKKEIAKSVTMYSILGIDYENDGTTLGSTLAMTSAQATAASTAAQRWMNVPLTLAAEATATSWLTIRGSVSHSLWGQHTSSSVVDSLNNMTTVAGGLGMTFGDIQIDGIFGQSAAGSAIGYITPKTPQAGQQFGFGSDFISRLAVTYNF